MSTISCHTINVLVGDYNRMELAHMQFVGTRGNKLATTFGTSMGRLHESISVHSSRMFSKSLHSGEATPTNMTGKILFVRMNTKVRWVMEFLSMGPSKIGHNLKKIFL